MCKVKVSKDEVLAAGSEIWLQKGGKKIATKEMSDAHVRNAFNALLKKLREAKESRVEENVDEDVDSQEDSSCSLNDPEMSGD